MALAKTGAPLSRQSRVLPWFRGLSLITAAAVFALVVLGGVVRVTESGLGCPDWPLCHSGILPPLESKALIEFSHRVVASFLVGPLVLATVAVTWIAYRREPGLVITANLSLVLLVVQALLGGASVLNELPGAIVAAHLALGQALLACLLVVVVIAYRGPLGFFNQRRPDGSPDRFPMLLLASGIGVYGLVISGSIVTVSNATWACPDWPLCQGEIFPEHRLPAIHMGHRLIVAIIGIFVMYVLHLGIRQRFRPPHVRFTSMAVAALFVAQVLIGAVTVWLVFPAELQALHLAAATALWASMVLLVGLAITASPAPGAESSYA